MHVVLEVLVQTIGGDEAQDRARIVSAVFEEDEALEYARPLLQYQTADQLIDEGLRDRGPSEGDHHLETLRQEAFDAFPLRHSGVPHAEEMLFGCVLEWDELAFWGRVHFFSLCRFITKKQDSLLEPEFQRHLSETH